MRTKITRKPVYEPVLKLPALPYEQFLALRDNIAVNGVLVPILVDGHGPRRKIIDGNYRRAIADELGYDCPEIVQAGLTEEETRTLARALNLARRQLSQDQKRQLIADQLRETPGRSSRWIGKQLGVHHATVASVRGEMEGTGQIIQLERTVGEDGKARPATRQPQVVHRPLVERQARIAATTLIHGDCRKEMKKLASRSIDSLITDPIYPEVEREYGRMSEHDWHALMREVVIAKAADERGGTTPFNCLPIPVGGNSGAGHAHPAVTPYELAAWWCRYVLPPGGVLLDPFCGSGTMLLAGLDHGASKVVGIDRVARYLRTARRRVEEG
jgi:ParB-like chromosome segregation protein Spo0J